MDFDPRWNDDPRDDDHRDDVRREESGRELNQGSRGVSSDPLERDARDPRDVFTRDLDLPRGPDRERVWFREHSVLLRGSESRALATTGAFRVVHADDLRDGRGQAYDPRSGERARIYHVRHRELYEAVGGAESRLRRPPTVPRALERIMLLDVILKEPDLVWLATSEEKMTHVSAFTAIAKDSLPQMTTPQGSYEPVRYFPDQAPIGIHPDGRWILICLLTQDAKRELRTFLDRHLMFLAALPTWTIRVVIPAHMTAHAVRFVDEARRNLRWRFDGQFRDDLRWFFETRRAGGNPDAVSDDDERAHRARLRRFSGIGFSALYPLWVAKGDDVFPTVAAQVGDALFREAGVIESLVLPHGYSHLAPLVGVA